MFDEFSAAPPRCFKIAPSRCGIVLPNIFDEFSAVLSRWFKIAIPRCGAFRSLPIQVYSGKRRSPASVWCVSWSPPQGLQGGESPREGGRQPRTAPTRSPGGNIVLTLGALLGSLGTLLDPLGPLSGSLGGHLGLPRRRFGALLSTFI